MSGRRSRGGGGGHGDGGEERWLLPYADMITLLLGLFIVLFAMSTIDAKKFDNVRSSLSKTFDGGNVLEEPGGVLPGSDNVLDPTNPTDAAVRAVVASQEAHAKAEAKFDKDKEKVAEAVKDTSLGNDAKVTRNEIGIKVSLAGDALFRPGEYQIRDSVRADLEALERTLQRFNHPIEIAGHTDGAPMDGEFGNYGLSTDRANAVRKLFRDLGYPSNAMRVVGFGPDQPAVTPPSPEASVPANRRIEITILEPGAFDGNIDNDQAAAGAARGQAANGGPEAEARIAADLAELDVAGDLIGIAKVTQ